MCTTWTVPSRRCSRCRQPRPAFGLSAVCSLDVRETPLLPCRCALVLAASRRPFDSRV